MSNKKMVTAWVIMFAVMGAVSAWAGNGRAVNVDSQIMASSGDCVTGSLYEELSEAEIEGLRYMREEEKLARDVYTTLGEYWGHWVFKNIMSSEQQHMDKISQLLVKYEIEDSIVDDAVGVFNNEALQTLYFDLVEAGQVSLAEAFRVGASIEDLDIYDLQEELILTDNTDIQTVYQNLMKGSRNHLRTFVSQLALQGESYLPQYLSVEEFDAIISSAPERGPVDKNGEPVERGVGNGTRYDSGDCTGA